MRRALNTLSLYLVLVFLALGCVQAKSGNDKVTLTTSSEQAKQSFIEGRNLQEKLRGQESRSYFEKAVAQDPNFAMAHLYLSFTQPSAKAFFESLNNAAALVDNVSEGEKLWILGFQAGVNGEPTKQREYYTKLVELHPNDERAQTLLGNHYFGQQEYAKAIEYYEKAVHIAPNFSQPYNQLGYSYRFLEKYDDSERTFKKYIEVIPDDPNPYDSYAELLLKIGRYDASIENYRKALSVDKGFVASHIGIATNYNYKGEHAKAREQLEKMYKIAKDTGQRRGALFGMTVSYVDEGDVDSALESMNKQYQIAKEINDSAAMSGDLGTIATILLEFGEPDKALAKYEASLQTMLESDHSAEQKDLAKQGHLFNLAKVAITKKDYKKAEQYTADYRKKAEARKNRFQIWAAHQLAGEIALATGDYSTAVSELEQTNLQNPYNIYKLAQALDHQGNEEKAKQTYEKAANFNALNSLQAALMRNHKERKSMAGTN